MTEKFPHDVLVHHVAVLGKAGSGKTVMAKGCVEWLLREKRRVCVIDPTSACGMNR